MTEEALKIVLEYIQRNGGTKNVNLCVTMATKAGLDFRWIIIDTGKSKFYTSLGSDDWKLYDVTFDGDACEWYVCEYKMVGNAHLSD